MKSKRLYLFLITVICLIGLKIPCFKTEASQSGSIKWDFGDISYTLDDYGTLTISGEGNLPNSISDAVGSDKIKQVIIQNGITYIEDWAFSSCHNLEKVIIPDSVTYIDNYAFNFCDSLKKVIIPSSVTDIGHSIFSYCDSLENITLSSSMTVISEDSFSGCSSLTSITIPSSVTSIGDDAFSDCSGLTSITIPSGVTSIGDGAFSDCSGLTSIKVSADNKVYDSRNNCNAIIETSTNKLLRGCKNTLIPSDVTSIAGAFSGCSSLTSITIPSSVTDIAGAFYDCSSLTSITIPSGVTSIARAFIGCSSLTCITIPSSVTSIGDQAFCGCSSLTSITIPSSVTGIGDSAFYGCSSLTSITIPSSVTSIGYDAFSGCSSLTSITISSVVTSIGSYAFDGCSSLTSITIPSSVTNIGVSAFRSCSNLTSIKVSADNKVYDSRNNCNAIIETTTNKLIAGCNNTVIPNSVVSIDGCVFWDCNQLISITIPSSVTSIGYSAFRGCSNLTSIKVSADNKVYDSRNNCNAIIKTSTNELIAGGNNTVIPVGVTSIGDSAFSNRASMTNIIIPETVTYIWDNAFKGCSGLTSVIIPDSVIQIGDYGSVFEGCTRLTNVAISNKVTHISSGTFKNCINLSTITIPNSVTTIESEAFKGCLNLKSITIPESVASFGYDCFSDCANDLTIYGVKGSAAESFANSNGIVFVDVNSNSIANCSISLNNTSYTYDGTAKKPSVTVRMGTTVLKNRTDYTVSYANNINAGTASVTITGKGEYTGTVTKSFTIRPKSISNATVTLGQNSYVYDGKEKKPTVTVKDGSMNLSNGKHYTITYLDNKNVGKATVQIIGKGNYTNSKNVYFEIKYELKKFINGADNWSFSNSSSNFGRTYYMSDKYWNALNDGLTNTEKKTIKEKVKDAQWGGSCYGMATTSILAANDILKPGVYQSGANFLHDILKPPSSEVLSLINYYFALQYTNIIQQKTKEALFIDEKTKINFLVSCVKEGYPTLLTFFGYFFGEDEMKGHAVVAYGVEYGTFSYNRKAYNGKILVYDNNAVNYNDDFCLYFNSSKGSWIIPYYEIDSEESWNNRLGLITNDLEYINYHGYLNGTSNLAIDDYIAVLRSTALSGDYRLTKASFSNGTWTANASSDDDIKLFSSLADNNFENCDLMFAMRDGSSGYIMKTTQNESLNLALSYENSLLTAEADNGSKAMFSPEGCVEINGDNTNYKIGMTLNDDYPADWYTIQISGSDTDHVSLKVVEDGWIISADNLYNVTVNANNDDVEVVKTFSTDYLTAFIYEINENTVGIKVDTDNNGTYETSVSDVINISNCKATLSSINYTYDGTEKKPTVTVKNGNLTLNNGTDYTVVYKNNTNVGTAVVKIIGKGKYTGTITQTFTIISAVPMSFSDVKKGSWYYNAVKYVNDKKIMTGLNTTTFGPNDKITRAMVVTVLYRISKEPRIKSSGKVFPDVPTGKWYSNAIAWAKENNIVGGYKTGDFGPNDYIIRQDFVKILKGYADYIGANIPASTATSYISKADAKDVSAYAREYMEWAFQRDFIGQGSDLNPKGNLTRAETAIMIMRFDAKMAALAV